MSRHRVPDYIADSELERRQALLREQLAARGIRDNRVLLAMEQVPRDAFVPESQIHRAYDDRPLPIGFGQTTPQPYIVALALQALALRGGERVLEVGTGSGYQSALLGLLALEVYSLEIVPELAKRASRTLASLSVDNVRIVQADGSQGYAEAAPYDAIVVAASVPKVPAVLIEQLAPEGRLVIPVGDASGQLLMRLRLHACSVESETLAACNFVPLAGPVEKRAFVPWAASSQQAL